MKHRATLLYLLLAAGPALGQASPPTGRPEAKSTPTISAITQGLRKSDGYFPFYYDDKTGKIYLEVSRFDQDFLHFSSLTSGVGLGGPERGDAEASLVRFSRLGGKVLLIEPNLAYRASAGGAEQRAVESAFAQSVLWGFVPVAAEGSTLLLDLTPFLLRDSQKLADQLGRRNFAGLRGSSGPGATYRFDETRSAVYAPATKNFPKNTEFDVLATFVGGAAGPGGPSFGMGGGGLAPDPSAITVHLHQALVALPEPGYQMRAFDPRAGFYPFSYLDFSAPMTQPLAQRYIRRHRLAKKHPGAATSEPVEPIVYYVDRGAPPDVKRALIEGGGWWNQAFEAAGYRNAFIVKELPEGADPMDIRYNVVNWVDRAGNPRAFSYGSSYTDPRTGEIIKGVVTLGSDRHRQDYLLAEGLLQPYREAGQPAPKALQDLALARIRQLSAHEIGHTLGLYHNFAASVRDRGSVMDYPFPRIVLKADGSLDVSQAYASGIGSWDKRAILWGYQDFAKGTDETKALGDIMKETLAQGYLFAYDPTIALHPLSNQWDDGSDPVTQLTHLMAVRRHVLDKFSAAAVPAGAPLATLEEVLVPMYLLHRYQVAATAKTLGGLYFTPAVKGDGQVPTRLVAPAEQWRAFEALVSTISPAALVLPEKLLTQLPPHPAGYPSTLEDFGSHTGAFDPLAAAEAAAAPTVAVLLNPERAARLLEYQSRDASQPGFLPVVDKLVAATWHQPLAAGYPGEVQVVVNNLVLKYLLQLAASPDAAENVRGQTLLAATNLKQWMNAHLASATPRQKANLLFGLAQLGKFETDPNKFVPAPALNMPPGAPIGQPGYDWLPACGAQ